MQRACHIFTVRTVASCGLTLLVRFDPLGSIPNRLLMKFTSILALTALLTYLYIPSAYCSDGSGAVARLCQAVKERKQVIVDNEQPEIIWSDGAMFEVAAKFPAAVQELISASKDRRNLKPTIARMNAGLGPDWKDATLSRSPSGETYRTVKSSDGAVSVRVSSAYLDYLSRIYSVE